MIKTHHHVSSHKTVPFSRTFMQFSCGLSLRLCCSDYHKMHAIRPLFRQLTCFSRGQTLCQMLKGGSWNCHWMRIRLLPTCNVNKSLFVHSHNHTMIKPSNNATTVWNAAEYFRKVKEYFSQVKEVSHRNKLENQRNKSAQNTGRLVFETVEFLWQNSKIPLPLAKRKSSLRFHWLVSYIMI